jgi:hypothetical protein
LDPPLRGEIAAADAVGVAGLEPLLAVALTMP